MKLMLSHQLVDLCQVALIAISAISRRGAAALDKVRCVTRAGEALNLRNIHQQSSFGKPLCIMGIQLLAGLGLTTAAAMAQESAEAPKLDSAMTWNLTGTTVVSKGKVELLREGEFAHDFIIESKASATDAAGSVVPSGTFKLVMSAFSPAYDQHGQKKGAWYVWGKWTLTDGKVTSAGAGKHRAGEISGQLSAELDFNPVATTKNWTAKVRLPMTRIASVAQAGSSQPARGEGALTMDSKREGNMSLNLRLWPQMQH